MHLKILKRCGIVLIVLGTIDIVYMIWCISEGRSYQSSLNIFAVVAGVFLFRGSLKVARWIAMISTFLLVFFFGIFISILFVFPFGFIRALCRQESALPLLVFAGLFALLFWLHRELHDSHIIQAQIEKGVLPPKIRLPLIIGVLFPILFIPLFYFLFRGETAQEAMRRAELQLGANYNYVVTNIRMTWMKEEKTVAAIVSAYNDSELKRVSIQWKE